MDYSSNIYNTKHYKINGINVHCSTKRSDGAGDNNIESEGEQLCSLVNSITSTASYNLSRMKKLNDEYKCSTSYHLTKSRDQHSLNNCDDIMYKTLGSLFNKASLAVSNLNGQLENGHFSTFTVKESAQIAFSAINSLKNFNQQNVDQVNLAFEEAQFDTNVAGVATLLSTLFMGPIGLGIAIGNSFFNNEFDGKIDRAYSSAEEVLSGVAKIGEIISHYHSDVYA